jgi:AraC-like DNA-binding protein
MEYMLCPFGSGLVGDNCGNALLSSGWSHPSRILPSSVLLFGRRGCVSILEEDTILELVPDRLLLLASGRQHRGMGPPIDAPASYYWIHFTQQREPLMLSDREASPLLSNKDVQKERLAESALIPQRLDVQAPEPIEILFRELLHEQERPAYTSRRYQLLFESLLIAVTEATISAFLPERELSAGMSIVYSVIAEIMANLTDPGQSTKAIARRLGHNPDYIERLFKEVVGFSIGEYILKQRIKMAIAELQSDSSTVASVAERCGFASVRHFLRQFKKKQGMTPSELRRRYTAIHVNNH